MASTEVPQTGRFGGAIIPRKTEPAQPINDGTIPGELDLYKLLATVYRNVDWSVQGGKSILDRWSGMLLVASRQETLGALVNSLCTRLGVGRLPEAANELIAACKPYDRQLLDLVADETVPVAMAAYAEAKRK
jgi:hypothetical protein